MRTRMHKSMRHHECGLRSRRLTSGIVVGVMRGGHRRVVLMRVAVCPLCTDISKCAATQGMKSVTATQ